MFLDTILVTIFRIINYIEKSKLEQAPWGYLIAIDLI